jgi:hypothetical protein
VKEVTKLNKPIYAGFCILELSKTLMYDFHYGYIKKKYGDKAKLLFTDTDSLCYEIETEDIYEDMYKDKDHFDLSDVIGKYNDNTNKKVIGKMKPEYPNDVITEFIGLRSKMYSLQFESGKEDKKAKGITKNVIKRSIHYEDYKNILKNLGKMYSRMKMIRSQNQRIYIMEQNKISLSAYDDKRYILEDGISCSAHVHYSNI